MKKIASGSVAELSVNDIQGNRIYNVYYDGTQFIIDNSILPSTETEAGIISGLEVFKRVFKESEYWEKEFTLFNGVLTLKKVTFIGKIVRKNACFEK